MTEPMTWYPAWLAARAAYPGAVVLLDLSSGGTPHSVALGADAEALAGELGCDLCRRHTHWRVTAAGYEACGPLLPSVGALPPDLEAAAAALGRAVVHVRPVPRYADGWEVAHA